ncbi:unknown [Coprobacillus sp. CAG:826]|nr:unknown [Coprobacillus sp. CAG:826]
MKSSTSINGKTRNELITASIVLVGSLLSLVLYGITRQRWSFLFTPLGFILSYFSYIFFKDKEEENLKKKLEEWDKFFMDLSTLSSFEKETLLKREMPLNLRLLLERSLSVKVSLDDYRALGNDLPFSYQCLIESLYFYETYQSIEEWQFAFEQFLNEKEEKENKETQKKIAFYRNFPFIISILFAGILFAFTMIS